jgi:hypothetical protein
VAGFFFFPGVGVGLATDFEAGLADFVAGLNGDLHLGFEPCRIIFWTGLIVRGRNSPGVAEVRFDND